MWRTLFVGLAVLFVTAFADTQMAFASDDYSVQQITSVRSIDMTVSGPAAAISTGGRSAMIRSVFFNSSWQREAVRWDGAVLTPIGAVGTDRVAYGINSFGNVTGFAPAGGYNHAFLYDGVSMRDLGVIARYRQGGEYSGGYDINSSNIVVGSSSVRDGNLHAFKYDTRMRDLGTLSGYPSSEAWAVNDGGSIVGGARNPSTGSTRAWLYTTSMQDIGTLGGLNSWAFDINSAGTIVGSSTTVGGQTHAFVRQGIMLDITPAASNAVAYGINVLGHVVGVIDGQAFLYRDGQLSLLTQLVPESFGLTMVSALDINDAGQIIGEGVVNGQSGIYVLSPSLLSRWSPQLWYPADDTFRADAASTMTDNYTATYANALKNEMNTTLAYSGQGLSLSYLETYGSDGFNHHVDAHNDTRTADAYRMHQSVQYADKIYGRVRTYPDGQTVLQYWLFYYFNLHPIPTSAGDHEGDWEMVQYRLDANGIPIDATYTHHQSAERCDWIHVPRTSSGRPIGYVATGTHATYFSSGRHFIESGAFDDNAPGDGDKIIPRVIDVSNAPNWFQWKGRWGGSESSPEGPIWAKTETGAVVVDGKWSDPRAWSLTQGGCTEQQTFPLLEADAKGLTQWRGVNSLAAPRVSARRAGRQVIISYSFDRHDARGSRRPLTLMTAVDSAGSRLAPFAVRTVLRGLHGTLRQPIGGGVRPYELNVRAYGKGGASRLVRVPIMER